LVSFISNDPLPVASKLFSKGLITISLLSSSQHPAEKAAEIVKQVLTGVENFPERFEDFLEAIDEVDSLQDLAKCIRETYQEEKDKNSEVQYK